MRKSTAILVALLSQAVLAEPVMTTGQAPAPVQCQAALESPRVPEFNRHRIGGNYPPVLLVNETSAQQKKQIPQEAIKRNRLTASDMAQERCLYDYLRKMGPPANEITDFMASLGEGAAALDAGAGHFLAFTEYYMFAHGLAEPAPWMKEGLFQLRQYSGRITQLARPFKPIIFNPKIRMVGVALEKPGVARYFPEELTPGTVKMREKLLAEGKIEYHEADLIAVARDERNHATFDVITSYMGVEQYVTFPVALETFGKLLKTGGRVYFHEFGDFQKFFANGQIGDTPSSSFYKFFKFMAKVQGLRFVPFNFVGDEFDSEPILNKPPSEWYKFLPSNLDGSLGYFERTAGTLFVPQSPI